MGELNQYFESFSDTLSIVDTILNNTHFSFKEHIYQYQQVIVKKVEPQVCIIPVSLVTSLLLLL